VVARVKNTAAMYQAIRAERRLENSTSSTGEYMDPQITQFIDVAADIVTIIGVLGAIIGIAISCRTYSTQKIKDRLDREYGTFDELDDKYIEFMYVCAQHPELDLFSEPALGNRNLTHEQLKTERALYAVLISIFERAYVMFEQRAEKQMYERQFSGWEKCMESYCGRKSFLSEWERIGEQFDSAFRVRMDEIIRKCLLDQKTK
jgi:hypothetical protein